MRKNSHSGSKLTKHQHFMRAHHFIKQLESRGNGLFIGSGLRKKITERVAFGKGVGLKRFGHAQRKVSEENYRHEQAAYLKGKKVGYQCWQPSVKNLE